MGGVAQNPQLAALAQRQGPGEPPLSSEWQEEIVSQCTSRPSAAQRQSFSYFPPDSRRGAGPTPAARPHPFEDPAGHRLSMQLPGENGGVKQEGPKMVSVHCQCTCSTAHSVHVATCILYTCVGRATCSYTVVILCLPLPCSLQRFASTRGSSMERSCVELCGESTCWLAQTVGSCSWTALGTGKVGCSACSSVKSC